MVGEGRGVTVHGREGGRGWGSIRNTQQMINHKTNKMEEEMMEQIRKHGENYSTVCGEQGLKSEGETEKKKILLGGSVQNDSVKERHRVTEYRHSYFKDRELR